MLLRREEDGSPSAPYPDGPIEIIPKIWLGAEDNARDWRGLITRGIGSVLNVAKEVVSPFDSLTPAETPQMEGTDELPGGAVVNRATYYPADGVGRPGLHYLKLEWSHGQSDLVQRGFPEAMAFVDQSLARGEGVLIQCVAIDLLSLIHHFFLTLGMYHQLSMWHFSIRYLGDRPRYASRYSPFPLRSPTSLASQRNASSLCICQTKK